jgi:hypothetical protein
MSDSPNWSAEVFVHEDMFEESLTNAFEAGVQMGRATAEHGHRVGIDYKLDEESNRLIVTARPWNIQ